MNVSGLSFSDESVFSSVLLSLLASDTLDSLPFTSLSLEVGSMNRIVNGVSVEKNVAVFSAFGGAASLWASDHRSLAEASPFDDYLTLDYSVAATSFDPAFSQVYCLDLLSNSTQSAVDSLELDRELSAQLNKSVVVLTFRTFRGSVLVSYDSSTPTGAPSESPTKVPDTV
jgi:hypothetical protein